MWASARVVVRMREVEREEEEEEEEGGVKRRLSQG